MGIFSARPKPTRDRELRTLVGRYFNVIGKQGPDCPEAREIRQAHSDWPEFLQRADTLDELKRSVGGCGCDAEVPITGGD